jgi:hypothetical protein
MNILTRASNFTRSPGDPKVIRSGPSVRPAADETARALGWFSIALGLTELLAPHALTRMLGMEGKENLVRAFGAREIAAGMTSLSTEKTAGLWSRVGGDVLDIATLLAAYRDDNPKKNNVGLALAAVIAITLVDLASANGVTVAHARGNQKPRDYSDRSGFPQGLESARGAAGRQ